MATTAAKLNNNLFMLKNLGCFCVILKKSAKFTDIIVGNFARMVISFSACGVPNPPQKSRVHHL